MTPASIKRFLIVRA